MKKKSAQHSTTIKQLIQSTFFHFSPQVYFVCSDSRAVLNDDSGINMFGVSCPSEPLGWENAHLLDFPQANNISWPTCIVHSSCDDLPIPNNASGLVKFTEDDYVEVGEYVEYACIRRGEFYETADVSYTIIFYFNVLVYYTTSMQKSCVYNWKVDLCKSTFLVKISA